MRRSSSHLIQGAESDAAGFRPLSLPLELWKRLDLRANGFELEPEATGKLLRLGYRIYEVPISYTARSREEGKELTWLDGVRAVWTLMRIRLMPPPS